MAYAALSDLDTRYGANEIIQLSDRFGTGAADSTVVDAALADADTEIDGYLAVIYSLPLVVVPDLVKRLACDIARYRLWSDQATPQVRQAYEDAVATLRRIADGTVKLIIISTGAEPDSNAAARPASRVSAFTDAALGMMP